MHVRTRSLSFAFAALLIGALAACQNSAQTGALVGTGIGALAGQAIGGDTAGTLIGAGVGAGVGYIIGNEQDKAKAAEMSEASKGSNYDHDEDAPLAGTRWRVVEVSIFEEIDAPQPDIVEFRADSRVVTTSKNADGTLDVAEEHYRVVDDTLIINYPGYMINAKYEIKDDELVVVCRQFRVVLERMGA